MGVITYKCPNCGGELNFDPKGQGYHCDYCGSSFSWDEIDQPEARSSEQIDTAQTEAPKDGEEEAVVYSCPSCGASIVTTATTAATFCYYCHNPVILEGRLAGDYLPDQVIPFAIDRKEAEAKLKGYVKKKHFVPASFVRDSQIEKMTGVYYPYWDYETVVDGQMDAEATRVHVMTSGDTEVTETSVYHVQREGGLELAHMTAGALKSAHQELVENVQPYRLGEAKPFGMGYLSGFQAEKRDQEKDLFEAKMRTDAQHYATQALKESVSGYTTVRVTGEHYQRKAEKWKYLLLPVWVMTYRSGGKTYYFAMNAQTGKISGKLPVAWGKLGLLSGAIGLVAMLLTLVGGYVL